MRGIINTLVLVAPIWGIILFSALIRWPDTAADKLAYSIIGALLFLCAAAYLIPDGDDDHTLDVDEVLSQLPPAEPGDEWDRATEDTLRIPRHWLEEQ
ncbi:hypothetical protein ACPXB3_21860 [Gordonia sp. DT219]|uniref:hypothetical protein n=1 Tax=Gordonia sp. DT219 TaxID=3416658 RepID=UPI003CEFAD2F